MVKLGGMTAVESPPDCSKDFLCSACGNLKPLSPSQIRRHSRLHIAICLPCHQFYHSGVWQRDDDGHDIHCQCCADGGSVICCDVCPQVACRSCLKRILGRGELSQVEKDDHWKCLVCHPDQLAALRDESEKAFRFVGPLTQNASPKQTASPKLTTSPKDSQDFASKSMGSTITHLETQLKTWHKSIDKMKQNHAVAKMAKTSAKSLNLSKSPSLKMDLLAMINSMKDVIHKVEKNLSKSMTPTIQLINISSKSFKKPEGRHLKSPDLRGAWELASEKMMDEDDSGAEAEVPTIRIGPDFQAVIPDIQVQSEFGNDSKEQDLLVWDPYCLPEPETEAYLENVLKLKEDSNKNPPRPDCSNILKDNEKALFVLLKSNFRTDKALKNVVADEKTASPQKDQDSGSAAPPSAMLKPVCYTSKLWTEEECLAFEAGVRRYGKNFTRVQEGHLAHRPISEVVQFYYLWKRTERRNVVMGPVGIQTRSNACPDSSTSEMAHF